MFNLDKFISDSVTFRPKSMFQGDVEANAERLTQEIKGKKVCVIGGAGSIGSSFIKAVLQFEPASVVVVDLNENGLAELVRDVRSNNGLYRRRDLTLWPISLHISMCAVRKTAIVCRP